MWSEDEKMGGGGDNNWNGDNNNWNRDNENPQKENNDKSGAWWETALEPDQKKSTKKTKK